jgi:hypothetical protein
MRKVDGAPFEAQARMVSAERAAFRSYAELRG